MSYAMGQLGYPISFSQFYLTHCAMARKVLLVELLLGSLYSLLGPPLAPLRRKALPVALLARSPGPPTPHEVMSLACQI